MYSGVFGADAFFVDQSSRTLIIHPKAIKTVKLNILATRVNEGRPLDAQTCHGAQERMRENGENKNGPHAGQVAAMGVLYSIKFINK